MKRNEQKTSLQFNKEKKKRKKAYATFILAFLSFAIVLAAVSFLILLKSVDFKLGNLVDRKASTTVATDESESTTNIPEYSGSANILAVCSDSGGNLTFFQVLKCDMTNKQISVFTFKNSEKVTVNGQEKSFSDIYFSGGAMGLQKAAGEYLGETVDRYFDVTESSFKKIVSYLGDAVIVSDEKINYKGDGFVLNLEQGEQSASSETVLSYYKYLDDIGKSGLTASLIDYYINNGKFTASQEQFDSIINYLNTDISMKDFASVKETANLFISDSARKPSLAVDSFTSPKGEENG